MDLKKAFTYIFEDEDWFAKTGLGAVISIVPILSLALTGYVIDIIRRVTKGETQPLQEWDDFGKKMLDGLMLFLVHLVYSLPILLSVCLFMGLGFVPLIVAGNGNSDAANATGIAGLIGLICLGGLFFLYGLALSILTPAIDLQYARYGTFAACFKLREMFAMIRNHAGPYFTIWAIVLGAGLAAGTVAGFLGFFLFWLPFGPTIIGALIGLYVLLVRAHLLGQFASLEGEALAPVSTEAV
jgi:hypothetical protein